MTTLYIDTLQDDKIPEFVTTRRVRRFRVLFYAQYLTQKLAKELKSQMSRL